MITPTITPSLVKRRPGQAQDFSPFREVVGLAVVGDQDFGGATAGRFAKKDFFVGPTLSPPPFQSACGDTKFTSPFAFVQRPPVVGDQDFIPAASSEEDFFVSPSERGSVAEGVVGNSKFFGPLCDAECFTVMRDLDVISRVPHLFFAGGPSAIFRGVRPIVIDPVDGVLPSGFRPHVGEKVFKTVPSFADSDPPSSPLREIPAGRVEAPLTYPGPGFVLRSPTEPVRGSGFPCPLPLKTPAALRDASPQVVRIHNLRIAAVTKAFPFHRSKSFPMTTQNHKAPKTLPGQVFQLGWHDSTITDLIEEDKLC